MAKLTQCDRIIRHLNDHGSITSLEAMSEYGIMRLASRINDLKGMGYPILSERMTGKNRYNETTSYSVYRLANKEVTTNA
ncbi:MAG: helix-turn-helix domain-containing protein [Bacteroidales bacterium]|nr:helix-turn-helix domain-containing protein [Bacteroidales bacterium]